MTDATGNPVTGLHREDFTVLEDGRAQAVSAFAEGDFPLSVALAIDRSFSMARTRQLPTAVERARGRFSANCARRTSRWSSRSGRRSRSWRRCRPIARRSRAPVGRPEAVGHDRAARRDHPSIDAIQSAKGRRALVLLSDGNDRYSKASAADALDRARRSDVMVYPVAIGETRPPLFAELAALTGGRSFQPRGCRRSSNTACARSPASCAISICSATRRRGRSSRGRAVAHHHRPRERSRRRRPRARRLFGEVERNRSRCAVRAVDPSRRAARSATSQTISAEFHRPEQPPLQAAVGLAAGDEIDHHLADRRRSAPARRSAASEARTEEARLEARRAAQLVVQLVADALAVRRARAIDERSAAARAMPDRSAKKIPSRVIGSTRPAASPSSIQPSPDGCSRQSRTRSAREWATRSGGGDGRAPARSDRATRRSPACISSAVVSSACAQSRQRGARHEETTRDIRAAGR